MGRRNRRTRHASRANRLALSAETVTTRVARAPKDAMQLRRIHRVVDRARARVVPRRSHCVA